MKNGKICVSVCAVTADDLIEQIKLAEKIADVVEIRFDCLNKNELAKALENTGNYKSRKTLLFTFRPKQEGGTRSLSKNERESFWSAGENLNRRWADFELDLVKAKKQWTFEKIICSHHEYNAITDNLDVIHERLNDSGADFLKIAIQANEIAETIAVWKLLDKKKADDKPLIPIAMGEAGKWTRILGLAHGAPMTYAALEETRKTAPGQISAAEMIDIYRVKELDQQTEIYGVVGNPVSHSLSPDIQNAAFKFYNRNAVYIPFEVRNLDEFIAKFIREETREVELNFKGFSVTIPHKQAIIKHLDFIDDAAKRIGAVNTVKIFGGKLYGYNTDAQGFIEPLENAYGDLRKAKIAVCGSGGAARACAYALTEAGASVTIFARDIEKAKILAGEFQTSFKQWDLQTLNFNSFKIFVNATPLGTLGVMEDETPAISEQLKDFHLVYDLVYNPFETRLLREAKSVNVPTVGGLAMLISQATGQFKIWTGTDAPMKEMSRAALKKLQAE